jgi:hypothetical protein
VNDASSDLTTPAQAFELLQGGREFFPALIRALDAARDCVQLETYVFDLHGAGSEVAQALMRAARRGVTVQVLVDGVGSEPLAAPWQQQLAQAGVQWQVYLPVRGTWGKLRLLLVPGRWRRTFEQLLSLNDGQLRFFGLLSVGLGEGEEQEDEAVNRPWVHHPIPRGGSDVWGGLLHSGRAPHPGGLDDVRHDPCQSLEVELP